MEKSFVFVDKSNWGIGDWSFEPDKLQFKDEDTGYPCLIVRNRVGALCGYVGLPESHEMYGKHYDDVSEDCVDLTFSGSCQEDNEHGICHIPEPGESDKVWWIGFDCAHYNDLCPAFPSMGGTYKNVQYVKNRINLLAKELHKVK